MKSKFFTNISILILLNLIVKAFWVLGVDRTVQNVVGAEEYGFYFSLFSFSVLFNILLDFGVTNYNNRRIAGSPSDLPDLLANIFIIRFLFAIVYSVITILFAKGVGYDSRQLSMLSILMVNQFIISFILYLRSNITALHLFRIDSIISVTDRFLMIVVCGIILWGSVLNSPFKIEWFVYCQTFAYGLTLLVSLVIVLSKGRIRVLSFDLSKIKEILRESAPYALLALFMTVYWRVDSVMVERMLPEGTVKAGIYAQAFRLLDAAAMIPFLFSVILLPMFSRLLSKNEAVSSILKFSTFLLLTPVCIAALVSFSYSEEIMSLLYLEHVTESASVFRLLMIAYLPVALVYINSSLLTAQGRLRILAIIASVAMILNVVLNYLLIPEYGLEGSAIASIITQSVLAVVFIVIVHRRRLVKGEPGYFLILAIYLALLALLGFFLAFLSIKLLPGVLITSLVFLLTPLLSGAIKLSELKFIKDR